MNSSFKRSLKAWFYLQGPGGNRPFPYFGERLIFPPRSILVERACAEGIYEQDMLRLLIANTRPDTWYVDVGANIGLMSAPLLQAHPSLRVLSIEASPATAECLARTIAQSPNQGRWQTERLAMGASPGMVEFNVSTGALGAYDGLVNTGRSQATTRRIAVEMDTLDRLWERRGRPPVSVIKIDVEGAELAVLQGASACIRAHRPFILIEWNAINLAAAGVKPASLHTFAREHGYTLYLANPPIPIESPAFLELMVRIGHENFFLLANEG